MSDLILKMIEAVSPEDTDTLDEIDARVWCWLSGPQYSYAGRGEDKTHKTLKLHRPHLYMVEGRKEPFPVPAFKNYCRSRDALKAIRTDGWVFRIGTDANLEHMAGFWNTKVKDGWCTDEEPLPTEELAELHAIIQVIQYERRKS